MELIVVNHHQSSHDFSQLPNARVIKGRTVKEFYRNAKEVLDQDVDMVISDQDPDGLTSIIVYGLQHKIKNIRCTRNVLTKEDVQRLEADGIEKILALDWYPFRTSALDAFEKVYFIIPQYSGLPNVNSSEIVFQSLDPENSFARDMSAIGTVCDYLVETAMEKIVTVVHNYPTLFFDLLPLLKENEITRYNVFESRFKELSYMFWAPFVLEGEEGCVKFLQVITSSPPFGLDELFLESPHPAVNYLQKGLDKLQALFNEELQHFEAEKKTMGDVIVYQPKSEGNITAFFANNITNSYADNILMIKTPNKENPQKWKYSIRRRNLDINIGLVLEEMQAGETRGGHPEAAGVTGVKDTDKFEYDFLKRIESMRLRENYSFIKKETEK